MTKLYEAWKRLGVALPFALALAFAPAAAGQTTLGRVSGSVLDSSGAVLPGATITLTNQNTNQVQTTVSGDNGTFGIAQVPVGTYKVEIALQGFKTATSPASSSPSARSTR